MPDSRSPTPDSRLPAAGLRAAADEVDSRRLAKGLRQVADQVDQGRALDDALAAPSLPPNLAGLVRAAARGGDLGVALSEWLTNRRAARQHWRAVTAALAYPALILVLCGFIYLLFATVVVLPFHILVEDMGIRVPANTRVLYWISDEGLRWFLALLAAAVVALVGWRLIGGKAAWSWLIGQLPLVGPAWHWSGAAELLRGLSLLVGRQTPLPEALGLTADGISDAHVGGLARDLAKRVEAGQPLSAAMQDQRGLPVSIVPLVRWGEQSGDLAAALRAAAELLEGRLQARSTVLVQVLPPLIFIGVAVLILSLFGMIGETLYRVINGLTM